MPIEHINKTDTLNEGRVKLNNAITAFNETVVEGDSSVEAAQARVDEKGVGHPTLKARIDDGMNSVNQQLAQTNIQLDYLDQEVERKRDKSIKLVKSDYDLSQDVNKWNINDLDEETRQAILEGNDIDINYVLGKDAITKENYTDESVYPEKTTFATSKNKAGELIKNRGFSGPFGSWKYTSVENGYTWISKVDTDTTYTVSAIGESDRFRIAGWENYPNLNDVADRHFTDVGGGSNREYTLNTNNNINYIVVYVATGDSSPPTGFQIEEGSKRTGYSDPGKSVFIDFADNSISSKSVKDLTVVGYVVGLDSQFDISFKDKKITTGTLGNPYIVVGSETYPLSEGEWSFADLGSPLTRIIGFNMSTSEIVFLGREEVSSDVAIIGTLRTDVSTYDINGNHTFEGKRIIPYTEDNTTSNGIFIADNATGNYYSDRSEERRVGKECI